MKKTLKDCPIHGHGANGLGCYCDISREMAKVLRIISEEKGKWKGINPDKKFACGVLAGIEAIEYRVKKELLDKAGER